LPRLVRFRVSQMRFPMWRPRIAAATKIKASFRFD
jgi:hypothetical protein